MAPAVDHVLVGPPTVSIVILTRHGPQRLERCLAALARLPDAVSREILILLNDADDDVRALLDAPGTGVRVLESAVNLGFAGGCNLAARAATGRHLVFLNDDTEVEARWLESLVEIADADPRVGAVGSCILFPDGSVQETGSIVWRDGSTMGLGEESGQSRRAWGSSVKWTTARRVRSSSGVKRGTPSAGSAKTTFLRTTKTSTSACRFERWAIECFTHRGRGCGITRVEVRIPNSGYSSTASKASFPASLGPRPAGIRAAEPGICGSCQAGGVSRPRMPASFARRRRPTL
jgi:hypothetical protein